MFVLNDFSGCSWTMDTVEFTRIYVANLSASIKLFTKIFYIN